MRHVLRRYKYTDPSLYSPLDLQLNNQQIYLQSSIFKMQEKSAKDMYIEVSIQAIPEQLDLSGSQSFSLQLHVTLRQAPKPILLYKQDTILQHSTALHEGGIDFLPYGDVNNEDSKPVGRASIHICRIGGPARPYDEDYLLFMEPDTPKVIDLPFNDLEFNTSGLEMGKMYAAVVPASHKVTWWRWATLDEMRNGTPRECQEPSIINNVFSNMRKWWTQNYNVEDIPILPEEEQLCIRQVENGAIFYCVGPTAGKEG